MHPNDKIYVAGHKGMVGSAILRKLQKENFQHFILRSSEELDLRDQVKVKNLFKEHQPDYIFLAAAKVGGIMANDSLRAEFIYDNLMIQSNVIHEAYLHKVKKLFFLGSSCIYPKMADQPLKEDYLLTGKLEPTNESYAIAKIAGLEMCRAYQKQYGCNFISAMPTNIYGPNDNYDLETSHVMPALIRKIHEAKLNTSPKVEIWGTGKPLREFLHVDDLADACFHLMQHYDEVDFVNIGSGVDITINDLAILIKNIVGFEGELKFDTSKPSGTPRKSLDVSRIHALGWKHSIELEEGIKGVYEEYKESMIVK